MLSDRVKRLLTTAVDGELDQVEQRAFQKVLQQSEEARRLYHQMKAHASGLNRLPRQGLPPHYSCQILQAIGETVRATPSSIGHSPKRFGLPLWANLAAALAVMLAVCAGTHMVIVLNDQEKAALAEREKKQKQPERIDAPTPDVSTPAVAVNDGKSETPVPAEPSVPNPDDGAVAVKPKEPKED